LTIEFSIPLATKRGIKELEPLFRKTDDKSELIIVDSNYTEEKRDFLSKQKGYAQVVYVPAATDYRTKHPRDYERATNLALSYCESDWIIRADDSIEFRNNFFDTIREDRDYFVDLLGHKNFAVIGQKLWGSLSHMKWNDYSGFSGRYTEVNNAQFSFSFGLIPNKIVWALNGWDELYDNAWGYPDDIDFLLRGLVAGYKFYFDKELMAYSEPHMNEAGLYSINHIIWNFQQEQILHGKIRAFNERDIYTEQAKCLVIKDEYIV